MIGFGSHIQITAFDNNSSYEHVPIAFSDTLAATLAANPDIRHIQEFITKPAIIKTDKDFMGVVLKGVSENYDWSFFFTKTCWKATSLIKTTPPPATRLSYQKILQTSCN